MSTNRSNRRPSTYEDLDVKSIKVPKDQTYWAVYNHVADKYPHYAPAQRHAITSGIRARTIAKEGHHV
jgi:hypothetical protein